MSGLHLDAIAFAAAWPPAWRLDGLALLFLLPALFVPAVAALYAPAYLRQERYRHESAARFWLFGALFTAGMAGTLLAADLVAFLVSWEVMTLASYVLVAHETRDAAVARAAFKYFFMTHVGTGCLLFAAVALGMWGGSFAFARVPETLRALATTNPLALHVVLALLFTGFATKAGLYPFGDWLPDAHPAAPAPVSAVLSGVMVKLGLYGLLRFFVEFLAVAAPGAAGAWGWAIGGFGLVSAVVGGAAACVATDGKVLLAYSSIAQSGIVALGLGAALVLQPVAPALAALALLAAGFHVVGDAVVKALLFLNAGALQWATGSRKLEDQGGLFEAMPVTGWTALAGALAIAGFPPLTAFTGKWLLLQATVLSRQPLVCLAGFGLLVASLLSVLYAVKFFAAGFANRPMRPGRMEVPGGMRAAQVVLAVAAVVMGCFPGLVLAGVARTLGQLPAMAAADPRAFGAALLPAGGAFAPLLLVALAAWALAFARACVGAGEAPAAREVWMGGVPADRGAPRVHPAGFYSPLREALRRAYPSLRAPRLPRPAWVGRSVDMDRWLYLPAVETGRRLTASLRRLHTGVPNVYIAWQLAGAAALALLLALLVRR